MKGEKLNKIEDCGKVQPEKNDFEKEQEKEENSDKENAKPISRSARAGLKFPVGRIHHRLKKRTRSHVSVESTAAVYCASIMEYLASEVIEIAGVVSQDLKHRRISRRHLQLAVRGDEELRNLVKEIVPKREEQANESNKK